MNIPKCLVSLLGILCSSIVLAADPIIIDVRSEAEFTSGHIAGALHMPHNNIGNLIESAVSDKNTDIVLYCARGGRAGKALKTLTDMGYTSVTNGGGIGDMMKTHNMVK